MQSIDIESLVAELNRYLGARVAVTGWFALGGEDGYLVAAPDDPEVKHRAMLIEVVALKAKLLSVVPPLGGGRFYYLHKASVVGTVAACKDGAYACSLQSVEALNASVDGQTFSVQFVGDPR